MRAVLNAAEPLPKTRFTIQVRDYTVAGYDRQSSTPREKNREITVAESTRHVTAEELIVRRLEELDWWLLTRKTDQRDLSPAQLERRYASMGKWIDRVLKQAGASAGGSLDSSPPQVQQGLRISAGIRPEDEDLDEAFKTFARMRDVALKAAEHAAALKGKRKPTSMTPEAAVMLTWDGKPVGDALEGVLAIWANVLGRDLSTSWDTLRDAPGGPLIRFVQACFNLLDIKNPNTSKAFTANAIRERIRDLRRAPQ